MYRNAGASTGIRTRSNINTEIAASLAGIPTGESISRQAFTESTASSTQTIPGSRPQSSRVNPASNPSRFVRGNRPRRASTPIVTRSYQELTRKLQRRRHMQRAMGATVICGLLAVLVSVIF